MRPMECGSLAEVYTSELGWHGDLAGGHWVAAVKHLLPASVKYTAFQCFKRSTEKVLRGRLLTFIHC